MEIKYVSFVFNIYSLKAFNFILPKILKLPFHIWNENSIFAP